MQQLPRFIHELNEWPHFTWQVDEVVNLLAEARNLQGRLIGRMESLGFDLQNEASLETLTLDVLKSSEIEGEFLNPEQVRSSVARRLGIELAGLAIPDQQVDGMVEMMLDATRNCFLPMTKERLFGWHVALFPFGQSGLQKISVGRWRTDSTGPMQVVSGAMGKETIHFQAPDAGLLDSEMDRFIGWFNSTSQTDLLIKAAIAHLWFVTIHPFEDGNGRIARALTDRLLAQSDYSSHRFYSLSSQIRIERKQYYQSLEFTQKGNLDITHWLVWFLTCLIHTLKSTHGTLNRVLTKAAFWNTHAKTGLSDRQLLMLNKILDGFDGKLTSGKWAKIGKCSRDTAIRDINDLISKGILKKEEAGGRSTSYQLL